MIKKLITLFLIISIYSNLSFGQADGYAKVKVFLSSQLDVALLNALDIDVEEYRVSEDNGIEFIVRKDKLATLEASEFQYEIIFEDYRSYYKKQRIADLANLGSKMRASSVAERFDFGSMGGFYTLLEIEESLDQMYSDFPELVTPKYSIGVTTEGRDIWAIKISDNPMVDEEEEAVYIDALHHAREPLSMAVTMNYAFWLLENYEKDDQVKYLVDNREIYIVPCVNPDGYEYNRETDPNGGGLWRKNRKVIDDDCVGVDLNRNYSTGYAHDESCASTFPCSNTYRGTEAFSELETQSVKAFIAEIKPNTAFSIHSTAGTCLMPYGYDTSPPAYPIYSEWASDFLSENDYTYGVTAQMLGYTSCGTTRSYFHSEGIYTWTPEIGGSGFWPLQSTIFDLVAENVYPLLYQTWIAGQFTDLQSHEIIGSAVPGESFQLNVEVKNKGFGSIPSDVEVVIQSDNGNVVISGDGFIGKVPERDRAVSQNFDIYLDPLFEGEKVEISMVTYQGGVETSRENISIPLGTKTVLFEDNAENGDGNWINSGTGIEWGVCADDSYDGNATFCDSNNGNSENETFNSISMNETIELGDQKSFLEFYTKWSLEEGDFVSLRISEDLGANWKTIKFYEGAESWIQELVDLSDYAGKSIKVRFELRTDFSVPGDGFYFDKFSISEYESGVDVSTIDENTSLIHLYPNPNTGFLNIGLISGSRFEVKVFDTKGAVVKSELLDKSGKLDLNDIEANIYFIQLHDLKSGTITTQKMIKL